MFAFLWAGVEPWVYDNTAALLIYRCIKWIARVFLGTFEIQRLLQGSSSASPLLVVKIDRAIRHSHSLRFVREELTGESADVRQLAVALVLAKQARVPVSEASLRLLEECLVQIQAVERLKVALEALRSTRVSTTDPDHVSLLNDVWSGIFPNEPVPPLVSREWQRIGFQGDDPSTDFRGMGLLALTQLAFLSRTYPALAASLVRASNGDGNVASGRWFPYAITGVNLTKFVLDGVTSRQMYPQLFARGPSLVALNAAYTFAFTRLGNEWERDTQVRITSWPPFYKRVCAAVHGDLCSTALLTPPQIEA